MSSLHTFAPTFDAPSKEMDDFSSGSGEVPITGRQRQVLMLAADGLTDGEIARYLYVSISTVRFHMRNLKEALDARTRSHLIAQGFRHGWIPCEPICAEPSDENRRIPASIQYATT